MADALIDKSLDDIIKERKISTRGPGRGGRGGRGGGLRGRGGSRPGGLSGGPRRGGAGASGGLNRSFGRRPNTGGIMKRRSGGGPNPNVSPAKAAAASAAVRIHGNIKLREKRKLHLISSHQSIYSTCSIVDRTASGTMICTRMATR